MTTTRASCCLVMLTLLTVAGCGGDAAQPPTQPVTVPAANTSSSPKRETGNAAVTTTAPNPTVTTAQTTTAAPATPTGQPETPVSATTPISPVVASPDEPPFHLEKGFTLLTFADFEAFGAEAETWEATDEGWFCTGKPRGYLYSKQTYQNFTLRLDYSFDRPESLKDDAKFKGNTGFLIYMTGEHKLWPVCLEVQGKHSQIGAIKENGGAQPVTATDDDAARQQARHAVGEWNSLEIVSVDGTLSVSLNGVVVSKCEPDFLSEGLIGIQSEDYPFEVRHMRVRRD